MYATKEMIASHFRQLKEWLVFKFGSDLGSHFANDRPLTLEMMEQDIADVEEYKDYLLGRINQMKELRDAYKTTTKRDKGFTQKMTDKEI